jgi:uncharacterized protein (TIGR01732 family)
VCHSIAGAGNKKGPLDKVGTKLSADDIRAWITDAPAWITMGHHNNSFALIVVLFILLIIVGASWMY